MKIHIYLALRFVILTSLLVCSIPNASAQVLITELMIDPDCKDTDGQWIELYNAGTTSVDTTGWTLSNEDESVVLQAGVLSAGGYYVLASRIQGCGNPDLNALQTFSFKLDKGRSGDSVTLRNTTGTIVDQVGFREATSKNRTIERRANANNYPIDTNFPDVVTEDLIGDFVLSQDGGSPFSGYTINTNDCNQNTFLCLDSNPCTTPTCNNETCEYTIDQQCLADVSRQCGSQAIPIYDIQSNDPVTPFQGRRVTIEAVLVGDFSASSQLSGFFLQEEDDDTDANPNTSDAIFVDSGGILLNMNVGDTIRVTGTASEVAGETRIIDILPPLNCDDNQSITPTTISFPVNRITDLEAFEGMAVQIDQESFISDSSELGFNGRLFISFDSRNFTPTNFLNPGPNAVLEANRIARNTIALDDDNNIIRPAIIPFTDNGRLPRAGDSRSNLSGILSQSSDLYHLRTDGNITFNQNNPRLEQPSVLRSFESSEL